MQATGNSNTATTHTQQSIRVTADGLSFYNGPEAIVVDGPCTRVPMADFRREEAATLLDYVLPHPHGAAPRTVLYNVLPELEVVEIFGIDSEVLEQLRRDYPLHRIVGINAMVLETMWRHDRNLGHDHHRLYVWHHDTAMLVFAYNAEGLQWANTFTVGSNAEALFFTLSAWRSLNLDAERDECLVIGDDAVTDGLRPYLRHATTLTPSDILGQGRGGRDIPFEIAVL